VPVKEIDEVLKLALERYPIPAPKRQAQVSHPQDGGAAEPRDYGLMRL